MNSIDPKEEVAHADDVDLLKAALRGINEKIPTLIPIVFDKVVSMQDKTYSFTKTIQTTICISLGLLQTLELSPTDRERSAWRRSLYDLLCLAIH